MQEAGQASDCNRREIRKTVMLMSLWHFPSPLMGSTSSNPLPQHRVSAVLTATAAVVARCPGCTATAAKGWRCGSGAALGCRWAVIPATRRATQQAPRRVWSASAPASSLHLLIHTLPLLLLLLLLLLPLHQPPRTSRPTTRVPAATQPAWCRTSRPTTRVPAASHPAWCRTCWSTACFPSSLLASAHLHQQAQGFQ
jgi:hypothetical protein